MTTLEAIKSRGKENHLTNAYNFAGPGTFYAARMKGSEFYKDLMKEAGRSIVGTEPYDRPINKLDGCAKIHDKVYNNPNASAEQVKKADRDFQDCIKKVTVSDGIQQKILSKAAVVGFDAKIIAETAGLLRKGSFADGGDKQSSLGKKISNAASFGRKTLRGVTRGIKRIL